MSNRIYIFDTTLRDGEQTPGVNLNVKEKLQIAKQLEAMGVDVIEAGFPTASRGDFEAVREVANTVKNASVAALARALKSDIDRAWEALRNANRPRIHTFLATSDLHMEYKLKMKPIEVHDKVCEMVSYAKSLCRDVEFSPEDASRTNREFLFKIIEVAIKSGANIINIPDTVGYMIPNEVSELIKEIRSKVPNISEAVLSIHCHDDLGMAVANSLAAIEAGVQQVECTINGLGERAGNAALEEVVMALKTRNDYFKINNQITTEQIYRASKMVGYMTGIYVQPNKAIVGDNAFAHESGIHQHGVLANRETYEIMTPESVGIRKNKIVFGKHSGRHAFEERVKELGYNNLTVEEINKTFEKVKDLVDKKKFVVNEDIEALLRHETAQVSELYVLEHFQISSGSNMVSTATVKVRFKDQVFEQAACGDGPVDAIFKAIDGAVNMKFKLKDYFIKAATGGKDALGEVTVKVEAGQNVVTGRGASTDVIEASGRAYMNAINNVVNRFNTNKEENKMYDNQNDCNFFGESYDLKRELNNLFSMDSTNEEHQEPNQETFSYNFFGEGAELDWGL